MADQVDQKYFKELEAYKFNLKLYEKQQERVRKVKKPFIKLIDPSILGEISGAQPRFTKGTNIHTANTMAQKRNMRQKRKATLGNKEAWLTLTSHYQMNLTMQESLVLKEIREVKLADFRNMQDYITKLDNINADLKSLGPTHELLKECYKFFFLGGYRYMPKGKCLARGQQQSAAQVSSLAQHYVDSMIRPASNYPDVLVSGALQPELVALTPSSALHWSASYNLPSEA
ncbi:uncharacterized protein PV07_08710 [Cladophialophora immunda]|uniref:Uncharacterized protein n=1 Tax=Cladophialophora immunda TaxID=569365 RepID=A0A0D2CPR8_9EURO|nr:uncharacterized protein PV07_08710 [Cladophialophora immunda]KIW25544.1 hypothetical protein PV07_08710 [Cladophialophora immunda]